MIFDWDNKKASSNLNKHDVSFEEAQTTFHDSNARIQHDTDHSDMEDRFVLLGMSCRLRILVVCHAYREEDHLIRIISARKAAKKEQQIYEEFKV